MNRVVSSIIAPPRLLAGVAMLFWGAMSGNQIFGLIFAILLEGRNWMRTRWDFGEKGHVSAFQLSLVMLLFGIVLVWVDGGGQYSLLKILQWAPVYVLPVELAQRYGRQDSIFLNTFFYFSRKRMKQDRKEGREVDPMKMNTGYPFILLVLLSASCSAQEHWVHWVGGIVILLACFVSVGLKRGVGFGGFFIAIPLLLIVGFVILNLMFEVNRRFRNQDLPNADWVSEQGRMSEYRSKLGNLGDLKQSREVMWRMWTDERPEYLRMASYDVYADGMWRYNYVARGYETLDASFEANGSTRLGDVGDVRHTFRNEDEKRALEAGDDGLMQIRGTIDTKSDTALVPSVPGYYAIGRIFGDDVDSQTNSMGSLRLVNRDVVIDYTVWAELGNIVQDSAPVKRDLVVPFDDREVIRDLVAEIGLNEVGSTREKVALLRSYLLQNYSYSTDFEVMANLDQSSQLRVFLTKLKKGHCEYFATATALLLRECGVPARYCVGFAVMEQESGVWLMRGTHAHAWCRVFVDGEWEDVDLTPPGWGERDAALGRLDIVGKFKMWLKLLREDFQVWRQNDSNKGEFWMIMGGLGLIVFCWIAWRLWRSRTNDMGKEGDGGWTGKARETSLNKLERMVGKVLGERPCGVPYGQWVGELKGVVEVDDLELIVSKHQAMRFDPVEKGEDAELEAMCERLLISLKNCKKRA